MQGPMICINKTFLRYFPAIVTDDARYLGVRLQALPTLDLVQLLLTICNTIYHHYTVGPATQTSTAPARHLSSTRAPVHRALDSCLRLPPLQKQVSKERPFERILGALGSHTCPSDPFHTPAFACRHRHGWMAPHVAARNGVSPCWIRHTQ